MSDTSKFICPECRRVTSQRRCPVDDTPTVKQSMVENPEKRDPWVGKVIDQKFTVEARIARGGMANVYRVRHTKTEAVLALKILSNVLAEDLNSVRRFYKEARLSSTLQHPNTVRVYDIGNTEDGACYMAMEYLKGETLGQAFREGSFMPVERVIHIIRQMLLSLGEAHEKGVVHRDLKPDNIFLIDHFGSPDFVKVLDFGIAKAIRKDLESLTQTGTVVGTPRYMSPEQAQAESVDRRSDLYALGVIMYELLAGRPPFYDEVALRLLMMHVHDPPVDLHVHRPDLDEELCALIMQLLDKDPDGRPESSTTVIAKLDGFDIPEWEGLKESDRVAAASNRREPISDDPTRKARTPIADPLPVPEGGYPASIEPRGEGRSNRFEGGTDTELTTIHEKEDTLLNNPMPGIPSEKDMVMLVQPPRKTKVAKAPRWHGIALWCSVTLFVLVVGWIGMAQFQRNQNPGSPQDSKADASHSRRSVDSHAGGDLSPTHEDASKDTSETTPTSDATQAPKRDSIQEALDEEASNEQLKPPPGMKPSSDEGRSEQKKKRRPRKIRRPPKKRIEARPDEPDPEWSLE